MRSNFLLLSVFLSLPVLAQNIATQLVSDGPYIEKRSDEYWQVDWICQSRLFTEKTVLTQTKFINNECKQTFELTIRTIDTLDEPILSFTGDFKVAAVSDFHGQYRIMHTLLENNGIIDGKSQWQFGNGHLVITGDVFDRGDKVTEILWFLYQLEQQAEQAGGQVHLLLGNHEVMILNGDLRYLHPKYVEVAKLIDKPFEDLFSRKTVLGAWLRSKPVLVKVNNMLFAHGGFHPDLVTKKVSLETINKSFKNNLVIKELPEPRDDFATFLHKNNGPIWYRGYFKDDGATLAEIDLLLEHFTVKHIIVGHTSQQQIETRYQGKVVAIDSSIKNGEYGEILLIDNNPNTPMMRGTLSGEKIPLIP